MAIETNRQKTNVQFDETTGDPYITLPNNPDFRLTPIYESDVNEMLRLWNEPSTGQWCFRRPYPYKQEDILWFNNNFLPGHRAGQVEMEKSLKDGTRPRTIGTFPLPTVRYHPTTTDLIPGLKIGEMVGGLYIFPHESGGKTEEEMRSLSAEEQTWEVAYDLLTSIRGLGVGTGMIKAMEEEWADWLGIGTLVATIDNRNVPSTKLIQKSGFKLEKTYIQIWPEEKGGGEKVMTRWIKHLRPKARGDV